MAERRQNSRRESSSKHSGPNRRSPKERRNAERRADTRVSLELWMEELVGDDVEYIKPKILRHLSDEEIADRAIAEAEGREWN